MHADYSMNMFTMPYETERSEIEREIQIM